MSAAAAARMEDFVEALRTTLAKTRKKPRLHFGRSISDYVLTTSCFWPHPGTSGAASFDPADLYGYGEDSDVEEESDHGFRLGVSIL